MMMRVVALALGLLLSLFGSASAQTTNFIIGETLGSQRDGYTGTVGFKFTTTYAITVTALGRWVVSGNSGTHTVALYNSSCSSLGSVSVATSGATAGQFKYVNLGTPVALVTGTYYVMSSETNGGDQWYDDNTTVTTSAVGSVTGSVDGTCTVDVNGPHSYVPVDFQYTGGLTSLEQSQGQAYFVLCTPGAPPCSAALHLLPLMGVGK
jgi:Domain of unknown function (DUF4082)